MKNLTLSVLLIATSAFAQDRSIWWEITNHTDNLNDATWRTLIATPTNESYVIRMEVRDKREGSTNEGAQTAFAVQIRSGVATNWTKIEPYMDTTMWIPAPGTIDTGFYPQPKPRDYTMTGTIISNVIAWVTWKGKLTPLVVESTQLGYLTKQVKIESKEVETVSPVTWYGPNGYSGTITNISLKGTNWKALSITNNNAILYHLGPVTAPD